MLHVLYVMTGAVTDTGELKVVLMNICALWDAITVKYMTLSELVLKVIRQQTPSLTGTL